MKIMIIYIKKILTFIIKKIKKKIKKKRLDLSKWIGRDYKILLTIFVTIFFLKEKAFQI